MDAEQVARRDAGVAAVWRSGVSTLYATMLQRVLPQDCLAVRWLPGQPEAVEGSFPAMVRQRLVLGSSLDDGSTANWLLLVEATLPSAAALPSQQQRYPTVPPDLKLLQVCAE